MDYAELTRQLLEYMFILHGSKPQKQTREAMWGGAYILRYLHDRGQTVRPGEISRHMDISTARMAAALNNLEAKGYVFREIDRSDRRQVLVSLTPEGRRISKEKHLLVCEKISGMLSQLGEQDARELVRIVGRLAYLQDAGRPAAPKEEE